MHNSQNRETSIAFQINNCQFRMLLGFPINEVLQNLRNAETDTWKVNHDTWHLEVKVGDLGSKFKQTKNERRCVFGKIMTHIRIKTVSADPMLASFKKKPRITCCPIQYLDVPVLVGIWFYHHWAHRWVDVYPTIALILHTYIKLY